jgi:hypothetical protein
LKRHDGSSARREEAMKLEGQFKMSLNYQSKLRRSEKKLSIRMSRAQQ